MESPKIAVLVASANVGMVAVIRRMLPETFAVSTAGSGRKALALLDRLPFGAVMVDHDLPDRSGLTLTRQIIQRGYRGPVILVVEQVEKALAAEVLVAGGYECLARSELAQVGLLKLLLRGMERARLLDRIRELEEELATLRAGWRMAGAASFGVSTPIPLPLDRITADRAVPDRETWKE